MLPATERPAPMLPRRFRVTGRRREAPDVVTLGLEPLDGPRLEFAAGQFNMLYAFGVGEVPISISGDPASPGPLLHTIRKVGAVTRALCGTEPGGVVGLRGPFGTDWGLAQALGADVVLVGGGIGVAPLRPAIRGLLAARKRYGRISVLVGARSPDLLLFTDELQAVADDPGIHVAMTVDHTDPSWSGPVGVVTDLIRDAPFHPATTTAMICGPEVMIRFTAKALLERGVATERIRVSMERNMKCAIGFCGHCQFGPEFICKHGPILTYGRVQRLMTIREV